MLRNKFLNTAFALRNPRANATYTVIVSMEEGFAVSGVVNII